MPNISLGGVLWRPRVPLLLLAVAQATPAQVPAQTVVPSCPDCEIIVEPLATLGRTGDRVLPDRFFHPTIVEDSRGYYYVAPITGYSSIGVYRPDGTLDHVLTELSDTLHLNFVLEVNVRNDTLIAADRGQRLLASFPLHGESSFPVPLGYGPERLLPLDDGGFLTQANIRTPDLAGLPLHLHSGSGEHLRSFGRSVAWVSPDRSTYDLQRNLATDTRGGVLVGWVNRYRIEIWSLQGHLLDVIEKQRSWFPMWHTMTDPREQRPLTWFDSVWLDPERDLLWCVFHVASPEWTPDRSVDRTSPAATLAEEAELFDTIVEVIDRRDQTLVARQRFNRLMSGQGRTGRNLYSIVGEDSDGTVSIEVVRLSLSPGSGRP